MESFDIFGSYVDKIVKLLTKTTGRDKVIRFWQYLFLFLAYTKFDRGQKKNILQNPKWFKAHAELRTSRKILRFLRTIQYTKKVIILLKQLKTKPQPQKIQKIIIISSLLSTLATILFFLFDHLFFLSQLNLISKSPLFHKLSFLFWFFQCFFSILSDIFKSIKLNKPRDLSLNFIKNIADSMIALSQINPNKMLTLQQIGAFGTVTSIISIYQLYNQ